MGKHIFNFKAFSIRQQHTAMKVCTDSCLFGAWACSLLKKSHPDAANLLDIGTGTGLLSLMIVQQCPLTAEAIDIDAGAVEDALYNFEQSPWKERLKVYHTSLQQFQSHISTDDKFDSVICNPPFFSDSLKSPRHNKNLSKHEDNLLLNDIISAISQLLRDGGLAFLMLSSQRENEIEEAIKTRNLYIHEMVLVQQTPSHAAFRNFYCLGTSRHDEIIKRKITIKDSQDKYSTEFTAMLKPYYLAL